MPKQSINRRPGEKAEEKAYLDRLQRESWNLELIISGLAIFGLVAAHRYLEQISYLSKLTADSFVGGTLLSGTVVGYFCGVIVFTNLLIHFLLRGLWIGAVGLRSVSGDINFYKLRLSRPFSQFLRRRIKTFDEYIVGLDRICSVIFSFSFLLVLLLIGFFTYWGVLLLVMSGFTQLFGIISDGVYFPLAIAIVLFYTLLGLLYLIDFLTLGWVKRIGWLSKYYYPVYRFFGFITLARLYRPLYYNFVDDKFGRRMILLAIPYIILIFAVISLTFRGGPFYEKIIFEEEALFTGKFTDELDYENLREGDESDFSKYLLSSDVVYRPVNKLTLYVLPEYADAIEYNFPEAKRLNETVINSDLVIGFNQGGRHTGEKGEEAAKTEDYIEYFKSIFELKLNGNDLDMKDAVLFDSKKYPFPKLVKYISLNEEEPGLQQLEITRYIYSKRGDSLRPAKRIIPFFYQPE